MKKLLVSVSIFFSIPLSHSIQAAVYPLVPGEDVVGQSQLTITRFEESFITLSQKYNVGFEELVHANPKVDPWVPGDGALVTIPTHYVLPPQHLRNGIVINVAELRIYYFPPTGNQVYTYPIGIGRMESDWKTPLGQHKIIQKQENANWYVPESIKKEALQKGKVMPAFIPPGPDNPMGVYKLRLSNPTYLIHGTNKEAGIGRRVSHGCINMYNNDVAELYRLVPLQTKVHIVHTPTKIGWKDNYLWLENHPTLDDYQNIGDYSWNGTEVIIQHGTHTAPANITWPLAKRVYEAKVGLPSIIGQKA